MWAERRAPSAPTVLLILALHAGVLAVLNTRPRLLQDTARAWSQVRLIPARPEPAPAPAALPVLAPHPSLPTMPSAPKAAMPLAPTPAPVDIDIPPPPAIEKPSPLQLSLPELAASAVRQPALDDPRSNTHVSRIGERIANDLGGNGRWVEERMDDFVRMRRGNTCFNLHRNRGAVLNPFNESAAPTPQGATPTYRCERR